MLTRWSWCLLSITVFNHITTILERCISFPLESASKFMNMCHFFASFIISSISNFRPFIHIKLILSHLLWWFWNSWFNLYICDNSHHFRIIYSINVMIYLFFKWIWPKSDFLWGHFVTRVGKLLYCWNIIRLHPLAVWRVPLVEQGMRALLGTW